MLIISLKTIGNGNKWIGFFALSCGTIAVVALGFSPTVYASGLRILYIFDVMLILYICQIINSILVETFYQKRLSILLNLKNLNLSKVWLSEHKSMKYSRELLRRVLSLLI
jgi:hypothetical protein